ncbi:MAG: glycosyltransferase family 9 protein [Selenomonadaceae bacterium]|nr:glycosyltransferase family 9 protein [Selenomonadaceae bacterium]
MKMYKNILVNALVNLGDVVLVTGAIALIKKKYPTVKVTMLVKAVFADAVKNNPIVDDVIVFEYKAKENSLSKMKDMMEEIKSRNFDLSISFDRKLRPAILTYLAGIPIRVGPSKVFDNNNSKVTWLYTDVVNIDHNLNKTLQAETYQIIVRKFFDIEGYERPIFARIMPENEAKADELLGQLPDTELKIALCVRGTFPLKTWAKENFVEVVKELAQSNDVAFYIVGAPDDSDYAKEVIDDVTSDSSIRIENFCGKTSLVDLAAIFKKTDLFVTVDTGAAHIAATTGVKMVTIYGCTSPDRWHPITDNAIVLTSRETCCPCTIKAEECPTYPKPKCLYNVTPKMVMEACNRLLHN